MKLGDGETGGRGGRVLDGVYGRLGNDPAKASEAHQVSEINMDQDVFVYN